jgi:iron(III) transport system substrate-binding protein
MATFAAGCLRTEDHEVVVYAALDEEFSAPILEQFTQATGIRVRPKFDTESTKTVGLVTAIQAERRRPRCDLFWNNEVLNTLRLKQQGLLARYVSPAADSFPARYRDRDGTWTGLAARARVLLVNTELVAEGERPASIDDLLDPRWKDRCAIAKPLFGTTATHAACLFAHWGDAKAKQFFTALRANARILAGNKQVALTVASGQIAFGLTDTDDAMIEIDKGAPVTIVYPDQGEGGIGTLFIPNTVAIIKGAPHAAAAQRLVDYLLSPAVETQLARARSAQIPLSRRVTAAARVATPATVRAMAIDFEAAAQRWETAASFLRELLARP